MRRPIRRLPVLRHLPQLHHRHPSTQQSVPYSGHVQEDMARSQGRHIGKLTACPPLWYLELRHPLHRLNVLIHRDPRGPVLALPVSISAARGRVRNRRDVRDRLRYSVRPVSGKAVHLGQRARRHALAAMLTLLTLYLL